MKLIGKNKNKLNTICQIFNINVDTDRDIITWIMRIIRG